MEEMFDKLKEQAYKAKDGAVKITKSVIEKTNNVVNQTKLSFAISETQNKIKEIYTEIGKSAYEQYKSTGEAEDKIIEKFGMIDALSDEIAELKERLAQLKETIECPSCGAYNHSDDLYCSKCGEKLVDDNADDDFDEDEKVVTIKAKRPDAFDED